MPSDVIDLAIVGAGPAGLAAACEARNHGMSVVLLDEHAAAGGQIYRAVDEAPDARRTALGPEYADGSSLTRAFAKSGARHIRGAAVWNVERDLVVQYLHDGSNHALQARHIVLATGAMERPFPIPGWTLPGVMGAGAAQILFKSAGAIPRVPVVLAGCGPLLLLIATQYLNAGVQLRAIVQTTSGGDYLRAAPQILGGLRAWAELSKGLNMMRTLRRHGVEIHRAATGLSIEGEDHARALHFTSKGRPQRIESSLILLHQGVVPNTQMSWLLRAPHHWNEAQLCWTPVTDDNGQIEDSGIYIAGDSRGIVGAKASATQGRLAALATATRLSRISAHESLHRESLLRAELRRQTRIRPLLEALYQPAAANRVPTDDSVIVCRCEEVTAGQIRQYAEAGCQGPNQTKAFGRCGMGPCQGRLCGLTVSELLADSRAVSPSEVGYYRIRPPIKPITLSELAGQPPFSSSRKEST